MSIIVRLATNADKDFIITATIEAEKGGTDIISYCAIFGISEEELREALDKALDENLPGQELCLDSFLIAEEDGEYAAAIAAWVEGSGGMASGLIKSSLLMYYIDRDVMMRAMPRVKLVSDVNIERENGVLQIESVYVAPKFRGRGLVPLLVEEHIKRYNARGLTPEKAHIMLMGNNANAKHAYEKMGYTVAKSKTVSDPEILSLLPGDTKLLMERKLD